MITFVILQGSNVYKF